MSVLENKVFKGLFKMATMCIFVIILIIIMDEVGVCFNGFTHTFLGHCADR